MSRFRRVVMGIMIVLVLMAGGLYLMKQEPEQSFTFLTRSSEFDVAYSDAQHQVFMARAIELSRKAADQGGGPFGAVIVNTDGKILGEGYNHVALNTDPTAHGEVMAIRDAAQKTGHFDLNGAILYTSTYPCPMCYAAAHWANINAIFYANHPQDVAPDFDDQALWDALTQGDVSNVFAMPSQRPSAQQAFQYWREKVGQGKAVPYNPTRHESSKAELQNK